MHTNSTNQAETVSTIATVNVLKYYSKLFLNNLLKNK